MKGMTVLKRCRAAEGDMARIRLRIQRRREAMECITPRMDVTGSRSTAEPDKMGAFVAAITELEADLKARELARSAEVAAACVLLDALPERKHLSELRLTPNSRKAAPVMIDDEFAEF